MASRGSCSTRCCCSLRDVSTQQGISSHLRKQWTQHYHHAKLLQSRLRYREITIPRRRSLDIEHINNDAVERALKLIKRETRHMLSRLRRQRASEMFRNAKGKGEDIEECSRKVRDIYGDTIFQSESDISNESRSVLEQDSDYSDFESPPTQGRKVVEASEPEDADSDSCSKGV